MPVLSSTAVVSREFIFDQAPFKQCHSPTIEQTSTGLVAAWFGGSSEGHSDVGIWLSRRIDDNWTKPIEIALGRSSMGTRQACWNPVLFQPKNGPLMIFYKVGSSPTSWRGMLMTSPDAGAHWSKARRLPAGMLGPIKNRPMQLPNGDILCGTSTEGAKWQVHFERTSDLGKTWTKTTAVNNGVDIQAIQPSLLRTKDGRLDAIGRTRQDQMFGIESGDDGRTWGAMHLIDLPNPNSGTDALTLADGRFLVVYNNIPGIAGKWRGARSPLNVAISSDLVHWSAVAELENDPGKEFSYPSVIQTSDGKVHIVYTWERRRIAHVVLDPAALSGAPIIDGVWPN